MKWIVLAVFIACLATLSEESALKCLTGDDCPSQELIVQHAIGSVDSKDSIVVTERTEECVPGREWESDCLSCRCTEQRRQECVKSDKCKKAVTAPRLSELLPGKDCLPGSEWESQCSRCQCTEQGTPACTEKPCQEKTNESVFKCAPGTFWKIDCNTCSCPPSGLGACTRMGCNQHTVTDFNPDRNNGAETDEIKLELDEENETDFYVIDRNIVKRNPSDRSVCKPNLTFKMDCNYCRCDAEGASYTCTVNECMEGDVNKDVEVFMEDEGMDHIERHSVCKPRGVFYVNCNACHCNIDGSDFVCANKPCPVPEDVELFHELRALRSLFETNTTKAIVCPANRMFVKDCNTCWCNKDGTSYHCTRKVCVDTTAELEDTEKAENFHKLIRECRPDEVFELDCNLCRCNPDGKSYSCTRRMCVPDENDQTESKLKSVRRRRATTQETPKTCKPGQEFRLDCNKCLCDNEGQNYSCTRIDCTALSNNNGSPRKKREVSSQVTKDCEPGSVFDQGCNVCRCSADGVHATCTTKRCKEDTTDNDVNVPDADPSFRCTPGEQFKRDCNDCTCSADGKSVFCTIRLCDQDITPTI